MPNEPYAADVTRLARENGDFRRVLHTTDRSQVVLMAVPAGGEIGDETHEGVEQILAFVEGEGEAVFAGKRRPIRAGDVAVVPAGTRHNFVASTRGPLKLFTIYTPPEHPHGTVHRTKAEADAAEAAHHRR